MDSKFFICLRVLILSKYIHLQYIYNMLQNKFWRTSNNIGATTIKNKLLGLGYFFRNIILMKSFTMIKHLKWEVQSRTYALSKNTFRVNIYFWCCYYFLWIFKKQNKKNGDHWKRKNCFFLPNVEKWKFYAPKSILNTHWKVIGFPAQQWRKTLLRIISVNKPWKPDFSSSISFLTITYSSLVSDAKQN